MPGQTYPDTPVGILPMRVGWAAMTASEWLAAYAEKLGIPDPTPQDVEAVLALAGVAAHASERIAAPVACWLTAQAGVAPGEAMELAQEVSGNA
jgi:hypothetical protein